MTTMISSVQLSNSSDATQSPRPMGQPGCSHRLGIFGQQMTTNEKRRATWLSQQRKVLTDASGEVCCSLTSCTHQRSPCHHQMNLPSQSTPGIIIKTHYT